MTERKMTEYFVVLQFYDNHNEIKVILSFNSYI